MQRLLCITALAIAFAGCDSAPDITAADEATIYTLTIVQLNGEDPPDVVETTISRADQLRTQAGVGATQAAISKQLTCVAQDLQMFDQTNFAGNEICFRGAGTATLANFSRGKGITWQNATHSYKSGESAGFFTDSLGANFTFSTYVSVSSYTHGSKTVTLDAPADLSQPPPTDMSGGGGGGGDMSGATDL